MPNHAPPTALTVYFDGSCPLCRREIALYQGLVSREPIAWVNVSVPVDCGHGLSGAAAFSRLWRCFAGTGLDHGRAALVKARRGGLPAVLAGAALGAGASTPN